MPAAFLKSNTREIIYYALAFYMLKKMQKRQEWRPVF
jgi:hypothetical protein